MLMSLMQVCFTLSQATKALRESRGIALLYFLPRHQKGVRGHRHAPAAPFPRERPGTHCTGGWVGLRAGLNRRGKSRPHRDSFPGPSSPQAVAIPTTLPRPHDFNVILLIYPDARKLKLNVFKSVTGSSVETALFSFFYVLPPAVLTPQLWKTASHDQKAKCVLWYHESKSVVTVQRRFRIEFGIKTPTKVSGCKLLTQAGSNCKRINAGK